MRVIPPTPELLLGDALETLKSLVSHNDPKLIRQYCLALAIQMNLSYGNNPVYRNDSFVLQNELLKRSHSTVPTANNLDDAQQFTYILQQLTVSFFKELTLSEIIVAHSSQLISL